MTKKDAGMAKGVYAFHKGMRSAKHAACSRNDKKAQIKRAILIF
jgi:hypothetical protein